MVDHKKYFNRLQDAIGETKSADRIVEEPWLDIVIKKLTQISLECAKELQQETGQPYSKYFTDGTLAYDLPYEAVEKQITRVLNEEKNEFQEVVTAGRRQMRYSIPFTKATLEELHKKCNDNSARLADRSHYYVQPEGGTVITVETYDDFLNGSFNDLYKFGHIPAKDEEKLIAKKA